METTNNIGAGSELTMWGGAEFVNTNRVEPRDDRAYGIWMDQLSRQGIQMQSSRPLNTSDEEVYLAQRTLNNQILISDERIHRDLAIQLISEMPYEEFKKLFKLTIQDQSLGLPVNSKSYTVRFKTLKRRR